VNGFGDREERVVASDQLPFSRPPQVPQERHFRAQNLGHAATVWSRIQGEHACTTQRCSQRSQFLDRLFAGAGRIRGDRLSTDVDAMQHGQGIFTSMAAETRLTSCIGVG
jgi:hypothetical protein